MPKPDDAVVDEQQPDQVAEAPLREQVARALQNYLLQLDGHEPANLYRMVLNEVEPPLLQTVLKYTRGNQSKAAEILGMDRSTLRKKLKHYELD